MVPEMNTNMIYSFLPNPNTIYLEDVEEDWTMDVYQNEPSTLDSSRLEAKTHKETSIKTLGSQIRILLRRQLTYSHVTEHNVPFHK